MKEFEKLSKILKENINDRTGCSKKFKTFNTIKTLKTSVNQTDINSHSNSSLKVGTEIQKDIFPFQNQNFEELSIKGENTNKENSLLMLKYLKQKGRELIPFTINNIHLRKKQGYLEQILRAKQTKQAKQAMKAESKKLFCKLSNQQNLPNLQSLQSFQNEQNEQTDQNKQNEQNQETKDELYINENTNSNLTLENKNINKCEYTNQGIRATSFDYQSNNEVISKNSINSINSKNSINEISLNFQISNYLKGKNYKRFGERLVKEGIANHKCLKISNKFPKNLKIPKISISNKQVLKDSGSYNYNSTNNNTNNKRIGLIYKFKDSNLSQHQIKETANNQFTNTNNYNLQNLNKVTIHLPPVKYNHKDNNTLMHNISTNFQTRGKSIPQKENVMITLKPQATQQIALAGLFDHLISPW